MPALPPYAAWLVIEIAVVLAAFAVYWAWNTRRLYRRYLSLREDVLSHLRQVNEAVGRLSETSKKLHGEVERLFSDPAGVPGIERLENVRAVMRRQKESVEQMLASPLTPALLMSEAVPALSAAIATFEENLSTVLRQWDNRSPGVAARGIAPPGAEAPEIPSAADRDAMLASLRAEHEALKKMHEELVAKHQHARDQIGQMKQDLAKIGDLEEQLARKESLRETEPRAAPNAPAGPAIILAAESEGLQESLASLRQEKGEARAEIARLESELLSAREKLAAAPSGVSEQSAAIAKSERESVLERELAELRQAREESERLIRRLNADVQLARAEAERRAQELAAVAAAARDAQKKAVEAAAASPGPRRLEGEVSPETRAPSHAAEEMASLRESLKAAEEQIARMQIQAHEAQANAAAFDRLQEKLERLEKQNAELQAMNEILLQADANAEEAAERVAQGVALEERAAGGPSEREAELEQEVARLQEKIKEIENLREETQRLRRAAKVDTVVAADMDGRAKADAKRIAELDSKLAAAEARIVDMKDARNTAVLDVEKTREQVAISAERLESLEEEMRKRLKKAEQETEQITKQYDQIKRDLKQMGQYVETLEQQNQATDAEFKRQSQENRKLKVALQNLMAQKAQLEQEVKKLTAGNP